MKYKTIRFRNSHLFSIILVDFGVAPTAPTCRSNGCFAFGYQGCAMLWPLAPERHLGRSKIRPLFKRQRCDIFSPQMDALCLTIQDCSGCQDTHCEFLDGRLPACPEFAGNPEEGLVKYKKNSQDSTSPGFALFPNPTSSEVYINMTNTDERADQSEILVYDLQGKQIQVINTTQAERQQLDISNWATGTYLFVLKRDGKVIQTKKLNVQAQ